MGQFTNIFPLSIYRDKIHLPTDYKESLLSEIYEMESATKSKQAANYAWLGDTKGHEFLFKQPKFAKMFAAISDKIREYTSQLGLNNSLIDFHYQRAWATVTRGGERIHEHAHVQSHISFAYYLTKPQDSGGIYFLTENHPNEFSPGTFSPAKAEAGIIEKPSMFTWNSVYVNTAEDEIVIFPSKTRHGTAPNQSGEPRVSISADVMALLKDSHGHETMMPHISNWQSFDGE